MAIEFIYDVLQFHVENRRTPIRVVDVGARCGVAPVSLGLYPPGGKLDPNVNPFGDDGRLVRDRLWSAMSLFIAASCSFIIVTNEFLGF